MNWQDQAACIGLPPGAMFVEPENVRGMGRDYCRPTRERVAACKAVCAGCPVIEPCREYAMRDDDPLAYGVAGGMGWRERQRARKGLRMVAA